MAEEVTVSLKVDANGAIKAVDGTAASFEDMGDEASEASDRLSSSTEQATESTQDLATASDRAAQATEGSSDSAQDAAQSQRTLAAATDQAADAQTNMRRASSNATQILFSAGDAVQDVQFGFAGAANNIAFMAEQFADVQRQAGGTKAAMGAIASSLTGAGGVILAFQALLVAAPRIIEFFSDTEEGAKDAEDALKGLAESVIDLEGLEELEFEPISDERAGEIADNLERERQIANVLVDDLNELSSALDRVNEGQEEGRAGPRDIRAAERLNAIYEREPELRNLSRQQVEEMLQREQERLRFAEALSTELQAQTGDLTRRERLQRFATEMGFQLAQAAERTTQAYSEGVDPVRETANLLSQGFGMGSQELQGIAATFGELGQVLDPSIADPVERLDVAMRNVSAAIRDAGSETNIKRLNNLYRVLRQSKEQLESVSDESKGVFDGLEDQVAGSLSNAFVQLGAAIGEGQAAMEALGQAAASILSDIARAIGQQLIAQGVAMVAAGNPAGSTYIASGGAVLAAAGALSAIGGAGGGGSSASGTRNRRESLEGGGTLGGDTEGFRYGGMVGAGQLVETHGMGSREFFRPSMAGRIMTRPQMRQGSGGATRVDVTVDGNITGPDLFELETRIRETAQQKDRYQRT